MKKILLLAFALAALIAPAAYHYPQRMGYRSFLPELEETAAFAQMGLPQRTIFIANTHAKNGQQYCQYPLIWKGFGEYDFAPVDQQLGDILRVSPDARFVIFLDLNTPVWLARKLGYDTFDSLSHVLLMPKYVDEASNYLRALVTYVEQHYGDRVVHYSVFCGQTSEWFEVDCRSSFVKDKAWRAWCQKHGLHHGESCPSLSELAIGSFEGVIFDPATESEKIDFWKFNNEIIADGVEHFSQIAKEVSGGKEVSADYGYYMICNKMLAFSGGMEYERLLDSPSFDCLVSPATYSGREIGGGVGSMLTVGSARLRGKRFYFSIDFWPHSLNGTEHRRKYHPYADKGYWQTAEETIAGNTRNAAFALIHHAHWHWFDMWGQFYRAPGLHERIAKIADIKRRFEADESAPQADVLIVADPQSAYGRVDPYFIDAVNLPGHGITPDGLKPAWGCGETLRNVINRLGVGYDVFSFNDLDKIDLSRFKAVVLSDSWTITPEKAKLLRERVLRDGRTIVWAYAPGVSDGKSVDAARVRMWAGVDFRTRGVPTTEMDGWKAVYAYDYRELTREKLGQVFRAAGCHFWTDRPTPVMANDRLLAVHVKEGGTWQIHLPRKYAQIIDLLTDRVVAEDVTDFADTFTTPDTKIYELR